MKFKSLSMLAITVVGIATLATACQSPNVQSQDSAPSNAASPAQAQDTGGAGNSTPFHSGPHASMYGDRLPSSLNLTDDQKGKIKGIQESYRSKTNSILTAEQKNQLKAARKQGKRTGMQALNLTDTQKQQLKDLRQSQRQEIEGVLTDQQKQQLQEMRQHKSASQGE